MTLRLEVNRVVWVVRILLPFPFFLSCPMLTCVLTFSYAQIHRILSYRERRLYHTEKGACPIRDFLASIDGKEAQKVLWVFRLIERIDRVPVKYRLDYLRRHEESTNE